MKLTNNNNIHLAMAVFLAHDEYDYNDDPKHISTTGLLNSTRQIIMSGRVTEKISEYDISDFIPAGLGNAVHNAIENAWMHGNHIKALKKLGYSDKMIERVVINPDPKNLPNNAIPIYIEQRSVKEIDGYKISGKYDFVGDGELVDHKTTGTYGYIKGDNDEKHRLQGSIYRWLNPDIITADYMVINYFFTDWSKLEYIKRKDKGYPASRVIAHKIQLLSLEDTEAFIRAKLADFNTFKDKIDSEIPLCTKRELWQGDTVYKYFKNPAKKSRATKNFDNYDEAQTRLLKDGSVGVIDIIPGKVQRCKYCIGAAICSQAKQLIIDGALDMEG